MPTISISDRVDAKLMNLARPFETREQLVERIADEAVAWHESMPDLGGRRVDAGEAAMALGLDSRPSLTHTKLLAAKAGGRAILRPNWNKLLEHMLMLAVGELGSFEAVAKAAPVNLRKGKYEEEGYRFLPETGFSVQGVDTNKAWEGCLEIAQALGIAIEVTFRWRSKEGAAKPGQVAILRWAPAEAFDAARASEPVLARDWNRPEEDEAWGRL